MDWEESRLDDVRRMVGDRGGVILPMPCRELTEDFLCRMGVLDRCGDPIEVELAVLRNGVEEGLCAPAGTALLLYAERDAGWRATGEESGNTVPDAVLSESRSRVAESDAPLLFVDLNEGREGVADSDDGFGMASSSIFFVSLKVASPSERWQSTSSFYHAPRGEGVNKEGLMWR